MSMLGKVGDPFDALGDPNRRAIVELGERRPPAVEDERIVACGPASVVPAAPARVIDLHGVQGLH